MLLVPAQRLAAANCQLRVASAQLTFLPASHDPMWLFKEANVQNDIKNHIVSRLQLANLIL